MAEVYESLQEPEKVVQTLRDMFPMQRKVARCYEMYLAGLMATEQYEEGHAEEFQSACEYFLKEYPYTGRLVKDDTDEILHDTKGFMDRIIERLMKESKGRKVGRKEFKAGMEDAYYKTMAAMQKG